MRFLNLIEQNYRVRFSSDCLGQLTTFLVAYISRRRSDQTGYGVFLHILTHIDSHHVVFIIKQCLRQCFCKLGLTDTGRSKEQEGSDRLRRIFDTRFGTDDRIGHFRYRFVLSDHTFVKDIFQPQDLCLFSFRQFCHRNTGPSGNDSCNLFIGNTLMYQGEILIFHFLFLDLQLFLQFRQFAVL